MVASYVFGDYQTTTLTAAVATTPAAGTSEQWTVNSTSVFPAAVTGTSQFSLQIQNPNGTDTSPEVVLVTNTNNTTHLQVQRGLGGTIKTHSPGDVLTLVIDSAWLNAVETARQTVLGGGGSGGSSSPSGVSPYPFVTINVGDNWQTVINANPTAICFIVKAGIHQNQFVTILNGVNDNIMFIGEPGAIMDGGMVTRTITDATTHNNFTLTSAGNRFTASDFSSTTPTMVWGGPGWGSNAGSQITVFGSTGSVTMDDSALGSQTYVATLVRPPVAGCNYAFQGTAQNVTIKNLVIRNYAVIRNRSAIFPQNGDNPAGYNDWGVNWTIEGCLIYSNANCGLRTGHSMKVRRCQIYNNGDQGIGGTAHQVTVDDCDIYGNNAYGNSTGFDASGIKFSAGTGTRVINNRIHDNNGVGIWYDVEAANTLIEGNTVYNNNTGISVETSYLTKIFRNVIWSNGPAGMGLGRRSTFLDGGNIFISASSDVEVAYNDIGRYGTGAFNGIVCQFQNRPKIGTANNRTVTDAVFNGTTTVTSATAAFDTGDWGGFLTGSGIAATRYIVTVNSPTSVTVSGTITSASGQTMTVQRPSSNWGSAGRGLGQPNYYQALQNISIHHNNIRAIGLIYAAGMETDVTNATTMFSTQLIKYYANSYVVDPSDYVFAWNTGSGDLQFAGWKTTALQDVSAAVQTPTTAESGPNGAYTLPSTTDYLTPQATIA